MPVTKTKPRDITDGDVVRLEYLDDKFVVQSKDRKVESIATVGGGRYRVHFEGEKEPRYYHATATLPVVTGDAAGGDS